MKAFVVLALVLMAWIPGRTQAQGRSPGAYLDVAYEAWSNGLPVMALDGDWSTGYERRDGRQRAYIVGRIELGASLGHNGAQGEAWRLGLLARADAGARASGEAAEVLYRYQSRTDPPQAVTYNADTDILFWAGQGLSLHTPAWRWGAFDIAASWDHMTLRRMRHLQTNGEVSFNSDGSYGFHGNLRDDNARAQPVFTSPPEPSGVGDALSLSLRWRGDKAGESALSGIPDEIALNVDDAWSRLRWGDINGDDAILDSEVSQRTPEGYIEYRAAIQGQYTRRALTSRIPIGTQLRLAWRRGEGNGFIQIKNRMGLWQRWLGWQDEGAWRWQVAVEPVAGALSLGLTRQALSIRLMGDKLNDSAHVRGAQLSWAVLF